MSTPEAETTFPREYSDEERSRLLQLARHTIEAALWGEKVEIPVVDPHLAKPRGAFVTLHLEGRLRGCVGYIAPLYPLSQTIVSAALAAAFEDSRFRPVTKEEAPQLKLEISVLSPLSPISPEQVEVGIHGLVISQHGRRGLLLPQVPTEHGWDRVAFLQHTCEKAGLPPDAWQHGATLEAFVAEVFGE